MIDKLSTLISSEFVKHNIILEEAKDVYKYGVEISISSIVGFTITLIIGLIFNALIQAIIFYVIFISLRSITGGYHAETYLKCNLIFGLVTLFVVIFSKISCEMQMPGGVLTLLFLPSVTTFIWLAPVENINKPIEKKKRVYWKITAVVTSVLLYILSTLLYINQHTLESTVIIMTIFMVSVLCMIAVIKKGGKANEKF